MADKHIRPLSPLDLAAPMFAGIERDATSIEVRLALNEYRQRHGRDHWRLYYTVAGRA